MTQPLGVNFDQSVRDAVMQILSDPLAFPEVFKGWVTGWVEANPPTLPIGQITGYGLTVPQIASVVATESTVSAAYTDLATVGPSLASLADGKYVFLWSAQVLADTATARTISVGLDVNGSVVSGVNITISNAADWTTLIWAATSSLSAGSNSVKLQYATSSNSTSFQSRLLLAWKTSNL